MNRGFIHTVALLGLWLLVSGCSNFQKILKSNNVDEKYAAAVKYYEEEDYYRATQLLDQVVPLLSGSEKAEQARFYQAKAHYLQESYILSDNYFRQFYTTYPRSPLAEEAMFLQAKSLVNQSPSHEQDQTSTLTAIGALQEFTVRYPNSELVTEAHTIIDELNAKLDKKAFDNAKLYYQLRYYRSAVVGLTNFIKEHPSSPYSEEASYLRVESQFKFAQESVPDKQEERYLEVVDYYQSFVDQYPQSRFLRSASQYYDDALAEAGKIRKTTNSNLSNL